MAERRLIVCRQRYISAVEGGWWVYICGAGWVVGISVVGGGWAVGKSVVESGW